jgi:hypothetical protein
MIHFCPAFFDDKNVEESRRAPIWVHEMSHYATDTDDDNNWIHPTRFPLRDLELGQFYEYAARRMGGGEDVAMVYYLILNNIATDAREFRK